MGALIDKLREGVTEEDLRAATETMDRAAEILSGRCKNCKHWSKIGPSNTSRIPATYNVGGYCDSNKIVENYELYEPDSLVYSYQEGGNFWTGPEFGCVHWNKRDD